MREIKFRAFDHDMKELTSQPFWVNGNKIVFDVGGEIVPAEIPERFSVMQYTGLKDKNGAEIYEGDIVHYKMCDCVDLAVVTYDDAVVRFRFTCDADGFSGYSVNKKDVAERVLVIGNIYETPELAG